MSSHTRRRSAARRSSPRTRPPTGTSTSGNGCSSPRRPPPRETAVPVSQRRSVVSSPGLCNEEGGMAWEYDPSLSKVEWAVAYLGIATIKGRFTRVQATLNLEDPDPTRWSLEASIEAASLDSGHEPMDNHVRS